MDWISVTDRLPSNGDDVLAFAADEGCFRAWYENNIWLTHESDNRSTPSHWMPMPNAPRIGLSNGPNSFGMTDNLISSETRPYSVWSETKDTANDIRQAWESRYGGPYRVVKSKNGYEVKYMGKWRNEPALVSQVPAR